jgi:hypothetical protein
MRSAQDGLYVFAMLGGLQATTAESPEVAHDGRADQPRVLTEAVRSINTGIRGFYYAVAALFLFAGPYVCIGATRASSRRCSITASSSRRLPWQSRNMSTCIEEGQGVVLVLAPRERGEEGDPSFSLGEERGYRDLRH